MSKWQRDMTKTEIQEAMKDLPDLGSFLDDQNED